MTDKEFKQLFKLKKETRKSIKYTKREFTRASVLIDGDLMLIGRQLYSVGKFGYFKVRKIKMMTV